MGLCISTMEPPKDPVRKRRKARPEHLHLLKRDRQSSKHRPPTPYPWRLRQGPPLGLGKIAISSQRPSSAIHSQTPVRARMQALRSVRGQPRLVDLSARPRETRVGSSDQQLGGTHAKNPLGSQRTDNKAHARVCTQRGRNLITGGSGVSSNSKKAQPRTNGGVVA